MPNYKKRKKYQAGGMTGGASQATLRAEQERMRQMQEREEMERQRAAEREAGLMALGERQRAAAQRQTSQSRVPTAKQRADYERMVREINNAKRTRTPSRPRPVQQPVSRPKNRNTQDLRNTPRKLSPAQQRLMDSYNRGMAKRQQRTTTPRPTNQQVMSAARQTLNRPATPRPTNSTGNMAERQRIQQQIAQLQARLRQLGG